MALIKASRIILISSSAIGALLLVLFVYQVLLPLGYPTETFSTFPLPGPRATHVAWDHRCEDGVVLLSPNGPSVSSPGPMMLDASGELVWQSDRFKTAANVKIQHYNGEDYLTFWAGEKAATSGKGVYYMLDSTYEIIHTIRPVGVELYGDLHEFQITTEGNALISVYNTTAADLTGMGWPRGANGWIVDNIFQELSIASGDLLFEWRASDHFSPADSFYSNPFSGYRAETPFDFYHLNSIDKDGDGNYLLSSRHFHSVTCISPSGETLWILGGRDNEFEDLSDGEATSFTWQHDARWIAEPDDFGIGVLTLFDNGKAGTLNVDAPNSRALMLRVNIPERTVAVVQEYTSAEGLLASSQGSVQLLPGSKQIFVGWGSAAAYSEFSVDGTLLCETHLGASWLFEWERMKSYRTTKAFGWHGRPSAPPSVESSDHSVYVSWNGATDVAFWALERITEESSNGLHDDSEMIDIIVKSGFESVFNLPPGLEPDTGLRIVALDADQIPLGHSEIFTLKGASTSFFNLWVWFPVFVLIGLGMGARVLFGSSRGPWYVSLGRGRSTRFSRQDWFSKGFGSRVRLNEDGRIVDWIGLKLFPTSGRPR